MPESVIAKLTELISLFDKGKSAPKDRPLHLWNEIVAAISGFEEAHGEVTELEAAKNALLAEGFKSMFEGWASVGYQASFAIWKQKLVTLKQLVQEFADAVGALAA